ncbi:flocculation protein FLO11 [Biomphalaria glabrata]|nr:flocculation protein FLO11 [Biomphalaria glabrata]
MRGRKNPKQNEQAPSTLPPCKVCGEQGSGFHYGVTTCGACKGFFRRSLVRTEPYICIGRGHCHIGPETKRRKSCPKCRLEKCLSVGMCKEAIKTGRYSRVKKCNDILEMMTFKSEISRGGEPLLDSINNSSELSIVASPTQENNMNDLMHNSVAPSSQSCRSLVETLLNSKDCLQYPSSVDLQCSLKTLLPKDHTFVLEDEHGTRKVSPTAREELLDSEEDNPNIQTHQQKQQFNYCVSSMAVMHERSFSPSLSDTTGALNVSQLSLDWSLRTTTESCFSNQNVWPKTHEISSNFPDTPEISMETRYPDELTDVHVDSCSRYFKCLCKDSTCSHNVLPEREATTIESLHRIQGEGNYTNTSIQPESLRQDTWVSDSLICAEQRHGKELNDQRCSANTHSSYSNAESFLDVAHTLIPTLWDSKTESDCLIPSNKVLHVRFDHGQPHTFTTQHRATSNSSGAGVPPDVVGCSKSPKSHGENMTLPLNQLGSTEPKENDNSIRSDPDRDSTFDKCTRLRNLIESNKNFLSLWTPFSLSEEEEAQLHPDFEDGEPQRRLSEDDFKYKNTPLPWCEFTEAELDDVVRSLKCSHRKYIGVDGNQLSKEQLAEKENSFLEFFNFNKKGSSDQRPIIDKDLYYEILESTGLDIDGRKFCVEIWVKILDETLKNTMRFFRSVPGFKDINMEDKVILCKASLDEYTNLSLFRGVNLEKDLLVHAENRLVVPMNFLVQILPDIEQILQGIIQSSTRLKELQLTFEEILILKAIIIVSPDREKLNDYEKVYNIYWRLHCCLLLSLWRRFESPLRHYAKIISVLTYMRQISESSRESYQRLGSDIVRLTRHVDVPLFLELYPNNKRYS